MLSARAAELVVPLFAGAFAEGSALDLKQILHYALKYRDFVQDDKNREFL